MRDEESELLRSTGKNGEKRNVSSPFGVTFDVNRFRKTEMGFIKALLLIPVSLVLLLVAVIVFHEWRKAGLDSQVREMCEKDGGIKVYEMAKLPADKFNKHGNVEIPTKENAKTGDDYYMEWDVYYYRKGNPELSKDHFRIVRRSDGKVLGEAIYYGRGGGDIPGPWHDSSYKCPDTSKQPSLESSIFQKELAK